MDIIKKYFPTLTLQQTEQFAALYDLYFDWNNKINVISRKDIENLYMHHVLHSLAIAKVIKFRAGTTIMDMGCGGGFPGIPLAIMFPDTQFHLVDSIGKKIKVATEISTAIGLGNVRATHSRAQDIKEKYHFVVSRAVMQLPELIKICRKNKSKEQLNALPNGVICLKGGNIQAEVQPFKNVADITPLENIFAEEFFKDKKVVYVPIG